MPYSTPRNYKPSQIKIIVDAAKEISTNPTKTFETYQYGKLHSIDDMPSLISMSNYTAGDDEKSITFDWHKDGLLHRDNGPASVTINKQKELMFYWWKNGLRQGQLVTSIPEDSPYFTNGQQTFWTYVDGVTPIKTIAMSLHQGISMIVDFMPIPTHFPMKFRSEMRKPYSHRTFPHKNANEWVEAMFNKTRMAA